jgi:hypothetical protein
VPSERNPSKIVFSNHDSILTHIMGHAPSATVHPLVATASPTTASRKASLKFYSTQWIKSHD